MWSSNSDSVIFGIRALISFSYHKDPSSIVSLPEREGRVTCPLPFGQWHLHQDWLTVQHGRQGRLLVQ